MNQLMAPATVKRRLPSVPYQAGVRNTVAIDRDGVLTMLRLRLQFRVTNGGTAAVGPLWMTLARIVRRFEIILNGADTLVSISGAHLASRALLEYGKRPYGMDAAIVLTASAATDYDIVIPLPFFLPKSERPDDTSLDLRRIDQAILAVTWGDAADLYTTPNGAVVSNVSASVEGQYLVNARPEQVFLARALDMQDIANVASNSNFAILQDRGSDLFWRSFHVATLRNNIAVQNIITGDVRMNAGAFVYVNRDGVSVLAETMDYAALPFSEYAASDRVYRIMQDYLGSNQTLINAGALSGDLYLTFGTTYTSGSEILSISREAMRTLRT